MAVGFSRNAELIKQIRGKLPHFGGIVTPIHCCPSEPGGGDRIKISKHSSEVWSLSAMSTKRIKSMRRKSTFSVQLITKHEGESRRRTLLDSQKGNHMGQWGSAQIVGIVPHTILSSLTSSSGIVGTWSLLVMLIKTRSLGGFVLCTHKTFAVGFEISRAVEKSCS